MAQILVIEDDKHVRRLLRVLLEGEGFEVAEASEGGRGLELYRQRPADLVIVDVYMPDKDGLETIMELRRMDPAATIVAMSGGGKFGNLNVLQAAVRFGAARAFEKPGFIRNIGTVVKELLGAAATTSPAASISPS